MAVRVTAAHTAEARAEAGREAGEGGVAAAAVALSSGGFLGLPAPFSEEDEDDVHRCGRCQVEFTALEDFVQHKIQKTCHRAPQEALPTTPAATALLGQEVVPTAAEGGPEEPITVAHIVVEATSLAADISHAPDLVGSGHIKEVIVAAEAEPGDGEMAEAPGSPNHQELGLIGEGEQAQVKLLVNKEGRYVCMLCHKTFKTGSILKAHMVTHSSRKDHECKLCGASFRTKGSLIRHHRRHTDERPYRCAKCGKSFRESGALTRHLKSLTPCTEKIRLSVSKATVVGKEEVPAGSSASPVGTVTSSVAGEPMETSPVIHLVTDAKGTVIHEVHVQMQELPLGMKALAPEDMVFLGDFNADCKYVKAQDWVSIRLRSSEVFKWLIPDSADTTVGNSDCAYDRIVDVSWSRCREFLLGAAKYECGQLGTANAGAVHKTDSDRQDETRQRIRTTLTSQMWVGGPWAGVSILDEPPNERPQKRAPSPTKRKDRSDEKSKDRSKDKGATKESSEKDRGRDKTRKRRSASSGSSSTSEVSRLSGKEPTAKQGQLLGTEVLSGACTLAWAVAFKGVLCQLSLKSWAGRGPERMEILCSGVPSL
ncbi:E4F transcription factor 1 [Cricetulus griseus]